MKGAFDGLPGRLGIAKKRTSQRQSIETSKSKKQREHRYIKNQKRKQRTMGQLSTGTTHNLTEIVEEKESNRRNI